MKVPPIEIIEIPLTQEGELVEMEEELDYEEPDRRTELIAACFNSIGATEYFDTGMESKVNLARIKRIKRMSLRLIDYYISEIYGEHFEDEED
jgi:hypothetical protein